MGDGTTTDSYYPESINNVKIAGTSLYYFHLQNAYDDAINGDFILARDVTLVGDLIIDHDTSVALYGGYDTGFSGNTGITTINGNIVISSGTLTIGNFIVN